MLANVVDTADLCSFILPAVYRRDPIALAVSTEAPRPRWRSGSATRLGARIGEEHVDLARRLRALRPWARRRLPTCRPARLLRVASGGVAAVTVHLVGAGPATRA
jgi:hypothetical protein